MLRPISITRHFESLLTFYSNSSILCTVSPFRGSAMKQPLLLRSFTSKSISRRNFLGQAAAATVGFSIVPRLFLVGLGYVPPSEKVNIAFIGVGSQGLRVMLRFLQ